jgi:hypothetical protein
MKPNDSNAPKTLPFNRDIKASSASLNVKACRFAKPVSVSNPSPPKAEKQRLFPLELFPKFFYPYKKIERRKKG